MEYADRMSRVSGSAVKEILKFMADPEIISFGGGSPAKEAFPVEAVTEIINQELKDNPIQMLQYGVTEGLMSLRQAYIEHIAKPKGLDFAVENVIATTGATQGIMLAVDALVNEGDTILVESPTFLGTLMVFDKYNCNLIPVETDAQGMIMSDLEEKVKKHNPKMLYCIPTFQNPTGNTLPTDRRKKIAALAAEHGFFVLEDDPYCDLRYSGEAVPPIKSFDTADRVILLGSFSKIISPGIRVGTVAANAELIQKMTVVKQCSDTHTANLMQAVCADFLNQGLLPGHLEKILPMYKERLDAMLAGIEAHFPEGTTFTRPEGGLFIWVKLPETIDIPALLAKATKEYKVAFIPGGPFFVNAADGKHFIRLNFSSTSVENIQYGMEKLGEAMKASL